MRTYRYSRVEEFTEMLWEEKGKIIWDFGAAGFSLVALFIVWVGYKVYLSIRRAEDKYENEKKNGGK